MSEIRIVGLDHFSLAIPVGAEPLARRFYGGVLGFQEIAKPDALIGRGGCWFQAPGIQLHLGVEKPQRPARRAHPAFLVADLGVTRSVFEAAAVEIVEDESGSGVDRFYVTDPFGNRLEFIQEGQGFSQGVR